MTFAVEALVGSVHAKEGLGGMRSLQRKSLEFSSDIRYLTRTSVAILPLLYYQTREGGVGRMTGKD